jgi:diadenosine tetraphosphate (Ap4A) HIT family hydrolase
MKLAERIAKNREVAGVHFPADSNASKNIAPAIWTALKENDAVKKELGTLLIAAKSEHSGAIQDLPPAALKRIQEAANKATTQKKEIETEKNITNRPIGPGVA